MINYIVLALSTICLGLVAFLWIAGKKKYGDAYKLLNKKEFPIKDLMFIGAYFGYDILKEKHLKIIPTRVEKIRQIYSRMTSFVQVENKIKLFYIHKLTLLVLFIGLAGLIGFMTSVQEITAMGEVVESRESPRPEFLEGDRVEDYQIIAEGEEEDGTVKKVQVVIPKKDPTEDDLKTALEISKENLLSTALNGNVSFDNITSPMFFYNEDVSTGLRLEWEIAEDSLIFSDGAYDMDNLPELGKNELVKVKFFYGDRELGESDLDIFLAPLTSAQMREKEINNIINGINSKESYVDDEKVTLPAKIMNDTMELKWFDGKLNLNAESASLQYFALFFILAIIVYVIYDNELVKRLKEREDEIELEFPVFIDKFILLLNCGSSVSSALDKSIESAIASDPDKVSHPLYEELNNLRNEMKSGISDVEAFENLGRRIRIQNVVKFSSLIGQAIRKGDREIGRSLSDLVKETWEKKKALAKEQGAKASSKMMIPLAIMLIAVIIMVMAPAMFTLKF